MVVSICNSLVLNINDCIVNSFGSENFKLSEKSKNIMLILVSRCIFLGCVNSDMLLGLVIILVNR